MARHRTRLHYKKLVDKIIHWLNADIDEYNNEVSSSPEIAIKNAIANNSADLKEKIELYLEGQDEF